MIQDQWKVEMSCVKYHNVRKKDHDSKCWDCRKPPRVRTLKKLPVITTGLIIFEDMVAMMTGCHLDEPWPEAFIDSHVRSSANELHAYFAGSIRWEMNENQSPSHPPKVIKATNTWQLRPKSAPIETLISNKLTRIAALPQLG